VVAKPVTAEASVSKTPVVAGPFPPSDGRAGRRPWKPLALVVLLVGVLGGAYLLSPIGDPGNTVATPPAAHVTANAKPTTTRAPQASEAPGATTPAPGITVAPAPSGDKQLASFVSSYFAGVTGDRNSTWVQLSSAMQASAHGRSGYEGWWRTVRSVTVDHVRANSSAKTAVVTLTYNMRSGSTSTETNTYTFVKNGAGYLIQSQSQH
jgi:hypothetical protein